MATWICYLLPEECYTYLTLKQARNVQESRPGEKEKKGNFRAWYKYIGFVGTMEHMACFPFSSDHVRWNYFSSI